MPSLLFHSVFMAQISLDPVFGWWAAIPLALILIASLWLTLTSTGISVRRRIVLIVLRLLAMLVLFLGWLQPAFVSSEELETPGAIAVLIDRSQSMTLPSDVRDLNRWQVEQEVWSAIHSATNLSIGEMRLVPYFYDSDIRPAPTEDLPLLTDSFARSPSGRTTDLGTALSEIGRLQQDPPLRGVLLLGDARQTELSPPLDPAAAARQMAQLDQPIIMIGIGPRGETSLLKDVALDGMPEHFTAFVKKELRVPLVVSSLGMQNQPIEIELRLRASGKPDQVVGRRKILASQPEEKLAIEFSVNVPEAGEYLLEAEAKVDAVDQIEQNNKVTSFVTVREGGALILYLEGQPRAEQLYLKRSLNESLDFDVEYRLFPERDRSKWPLEMGVDLQPYDAIVIGDLHASALSATALRAIANRVRRGAGVLLMGGYRSYGAGNYGGSPLDPVFPVELPPQRQAWNAPVNPRLHILEDISLRPTRPHPVTTFAPEPDNSRLWSRLPPLKGANRLKLRAAPGIQVLLEGPDREPILTTGEYGEGRVLAFAGDTTWRWWLAGDQKLHQQFWRQAVLWLIGRDSLQEGFRLVMDRRRWSLGDTPKLSVEWFGGDGTKPMPEEIKIELSREGRWLQNLESSVSGDNARVATITGLETSGLYKVALTAASGQGERYQAELAFVVRDESRELSQPAADWQMMENIVSANAAAGGQRVLPEDVGAALQWLRERQDATRITTLQRRRLGDAAWDAWLYLVVFSLLMAGEWGLRKAWQLP